MKPVREAKARSRAVMSLKKKKVFISVKEAYDHAQHTEITEFGVSQDCRVIGFND
jgi:hypothetical protein